MPVARFKKIGAGITIKTRPLTHRLVHIRSLKHLHQASVIIDFTKITKAETISSLYF